VSKTFADATNEEFQFNFRPSNTVPVQNEENQPYFRREATVSNTSRYSPKKALTIRSKLRMFFSILLTFLLISSSDAFVLVSNSGEITMLGSVDIDPLGQDTENKSH
jgi:hypothetical protein